MSQVEVEASRLGGAFGGKEDQGSEWAALAALGASLSGLPVKIYLRRRDDMRYTGKRHPYSSDYRIGLDAGGKILAFEADYYQNSGACCDLSPAILSRSLFHATNAYRVPNVRITGHMCRTNLLPFTAFRGFGAPQAIFVVEAAIDAAARKAGLDPVEVRRNNLFATGDSFHYGMPIEDCRARESFDRLLEKCRWAELRREMTAFNASHGLEKRGAALMPLCFGVSFTNFVMNQGGALVHVYKDGSVLVSTGAIEMGQQVSRKIARVVSRSLGASLDRIRVGKTSTLTVANTYPTAASTGSDINGMAALAACEEIRKRLLAKAAELLGVPEAELSLADGRVMRNGAPTPLSWDQLVAKTHAARVDLSAHGFYATPDLNFDEAAGSGKPFAYHVYGCAAVTATLDVLRGTYRIDDAFIVHDIGDSLDEAVDRGQVEGGFAQGLGWALIEDLRFDAKGRLLADSLSTYKVPDIHFVPAHVEVEFIRGANPKAIMGSKAVGEPPLMYGIAGYFAVLDALRAARPEASPATTSPSRPRRPSPSSMEQTHDRQGWSPRPPRRGRFPPPRPQGLGRAHRRDGTGARGQDGGGGGRGPGALGVPRRHRSPRPLRRARLHPPRGLFPRDERGGQGRRHHGDRHALHLAASRHHPRRPRQQARRHRGQGHCRLRVVRRSLGPHRRHEP